MDSDACRCSEQEIAQARLFNKKLAWLPRFRIRNRFTPMALQTLLRMSQVGRHRRLGRHGLHAECRIVTVDGVSVPVRIIRAPGNAKGIVLDFHGGGWVIGNAQMNDDLNVGLVKACEVTVISVDYRLAVSTPLEGLLQDCLCAARWLLAEAPEFADLPVTIVGESAGGHLAVATLLGLKAWPDLLRRVTAAVLYYGVYDLNGSPSVRAAGPETLLLDGPGMVEAFRMLTPGLNDAQRQQAPVSPLYGDFTGFPPALMFVGELDPLRDDTFGLARRWAGSAEVDVHRLPAAPHGFIHFPTKMASKVLAYTHQWVTRRLQG